MSGYSNNTDLLKKKQNAHTPAHPKIEIIFVHVNIWEP